jgi:hypothetical protein
MRNGYLSLFSAGLAANLPSASSDNDGNLPKLYYATDTNALYSLNPAHSGGADWELLFQLKPVTVANLPTSKIIAGTLAVVSDATTPSVGGALTGGSNVQCAAIYSGSAWKVA